MRERLRVLVVFGGRSGEHEVSVVSARFVVDALERLGHDVVPVGISRAGRWIRCDPRSADVVPAVGDPYTLRPEPGANDVDAAFPVLHGPYGEDGCVQGIFELASLPYVGAGLEGSTIGMNKAVQKRLLSEAGLPIVEFLAFGPREWQQDAPGITERVAKLGWPVFAKPARLGSSVGTSKVSGEGDLSSAVSRAFRHDDLVLVEALGGPRELEIGVLEGPELSVVGEVVPEGDFYDYRSKYRGTETVLRIPAPLRDATERRLRELAAAAFSITGCEGMGRIDFFYEPETEHLWVNEINTIPGLTPNSMFPKVWEEAGRPFPEVVRALLEHARDRQERRGRLDAERAAAHAEETGGPA